MNRCAEICPARHRVRSVASALAASLLVTTFLVRAVDAQTTELVSLTSAGDQTNNTSDSPSVSADGRYVAFISKANNLIASDTNGQVDVFVRDRTAGTTVRVSVSTAGAESDKDVTNPSISSDGRFVAFESVATTLVANDLNGQKDVFLHDRDVDTDGIFDEAGAISTVRASVDDAGLERTRSSSLPAISGDGRWVAFQAAEGSGKQDVRVFDRDAGTSRVLSIDSSGVVGNNKSENPQLSASGRYLVFESNSTNLVAGDSNSTVDIFWVDRDGDGNGTFDEALGTVTLRASLNSAEEEGDGASKHADVSDDGVHVVFSSTAENLDTGITNNKRDVFVRDMSVGETFRISLGPGGVEGDAESTLPWVSADGRCVLFQSAASTLVGNDTNSRRDVFLYDRDADNDGALDDLGGVSLARVSVDSDGVQAGNHSGDIVRPVISADGLSAVFNSAASNLVVDDDNGKRDVFLHRTVCGDIGFLFNPITPCRLVNTLDADGPVGGPSLPGNDERTFSAESICGIPANAKALSVVLTVVAPQAAGYFTLYPVGTSRPVASSLNFTAGAIVNNNQFVALSKDGTAAFKAYNGAPAVADLIVDVNGYFN